MINIKELIIYFLFWLGTVITLIAIIALVSVSGLGYGIGALTGVQVIGQWIADILKNIVAFVAPATLVVSLQAIWLLASKK